MRILYAFGGIHASLDGVIEHLPPILAPIRPRKCQFEFQLGVFHVILKLQEGARVERIDGSQDKSSVRACLHDVDGIGQ